MLLPTNLCTPFFERRRSLEQWMKATIYLKKAFQDNFPQVQWCPINTCYNMMKNSHKYDSGKLGKTSHMISEETERFMNISTLDIQFATFWELAWKTVPDNYILWWEEKLQ